jgi:hypothetical protein
MQQSKDINSIAETDKYCLNSSILIKTFTTVLKEFKLSYINKLFSKSKKRGFDAAKIFETLFVLTFIDIKNVQQLVNSGYSLEIVNKKDVFYEFLKNQNIDWRTILHLFSKQFFKIVKEKGDQSTTDSPKCIILDDTLVAKTGKKMECLGKVYDHCSHTYSLGMKILTLGFWDGKSFVPLNFSIHNEPGKNKLRGMKISELKAQFQKKRDKLSSGYNRVQEVALDKIEMAILMIKSSVKSLETVDYVLADSWFMCEKFISEITKLKAKSGNQLNVLGLMKSNRIITIVGVKMNANKVPELKRKSIKFNRVFKAQYIDQIVDYKGNPMRIFWIKFKGQNNWKMLICTDQKLSFQTAMKYYQIRWSIEVFFKECKQNLGISNCQSIDFDSHIAHVSICFMQYMALSLRKRFDDYETFGALFKHVRQEILEATLVDKIWTFLIEIFELIIGELEIELEIILKMIFQNRTQVEGKIKKAFECLFSMPKAITVKSS